jgi:nuclear transport factor 2 (NTF2) superfamily protein
MAESRPPLPPFTLEAATQKVRMAEDAWNTRDPQRVALACTTDSRWRNRAEFLEGRADLLFNSGLVLHYPIISEAPSAERHC